MAENREGIRTAFACRIKIWHESIDEVVVKTRDISDSGVFILTEPATMPGVGEVVTGQVQGMMADAPILNMEIVRVEAGGLGLRFISA